MDRAGSLHGLADAKQAARLGIKRTHADAQCRLTRDGSRFGQIDLVGGWWDLGAAPDDESVPALGQHTDEVLRELGRDSEEIETLLAEGVIGVGRRVPTLSD